MELKKEAPGIFWASFLVHLIIIKSIIGKFNNTGLFNFFLRHSFINLLVNFHYFERIFYNSVE